MKIQCIVKFCGDNFVSKFLLGLTIASKIKASEKLLFSVMHKKPLQKDLAHTLSPDKILSTLL